MAIIIITAGLIFILSFVFMINVHNGLRRLFDSFKPSRPPFSRPKEHTND